MREIKIKEDWMTDFYALEKLYYEVTTKERILSLSLTLNNGEQELFSSNYYSNFVETFKEYDWLKQNFYEKYVKLIQQDTDKYWEVNFNKKAIVFYE